MWLFVNLKSQDPAAWARSRLMAAWARSRLGLYSMPIWLSPK